MERCFRCLLLVGCLAFLAVLGNGANGQTTSTASTSDNATGSDDVTPSNDTSAGDVTSPSDTSSESVIPANDTDEASAATGVPEKADFVVLDRNREPCLLASLNITIHFKYHVQEGLVRQTYDLVSKQNTQDGSSYQGSCQDKSSTLSVTWNDTFTLNFTFIMQSAKEGKRNEIDMDVLPAGVNSSSESWSLHQVSLSYDTANQHMFPGAINPAVEMVSAKDLNLFRTPWGMSYVCHTPEVVTVEFKDVDLAFNYVHLMPFDVHSRNFSNDTVQCSGDMVGKPGAEESYTVPLVVAAVLASIVIIILVVYSAVRCVARRVRQAEYKQME